jgi:hypothetical protein
MVYLEKRRVRRPSFRRKQMRRALNITNERFEAMRRDLE